jgi:hypothetical protein
MTKAKTDNIPVWLPMEKVYDIDLSRFGGVAQPALAMVRKRFRLGEYRYIDANGRQYGADLDADFWLLADIDPKTGSAICPRYIVGAAGPVRHIPARQAYKLELKAPPGAAKVPHAEAKKWRKWVTEYAQEPQYQKFSRNKGAELMSKRLKEEHKIEREQSTIAEFLTALSRTEK